jgi:hypothetical protein
MSITVMNFGPGTRHGPGHALSRSITATSMHRRIDQPSHRPTVAPTNRRIDPPPRSTPMTHRRSPLRRSTVIAAIGLACVAAATLSLAAPASAATATGSLRGTASNRCVDVPNFTATDGTALMLWDCAGSDNQQWTYTTRKQLLVYGGKCLDALLPNNAPGTKVEIWTCNGQTNQQWNINSNGTVTNVQSGLCLDPSNNGTTNGTPIQLWTCTGQNNQRFTAPSSATGTACQATGHVTYSLARASAPSADQTDAYSRITTAMDKAVAVYNCYTSLSGGLTIEYNTGVATADGSYGGHIRFGSRASMVQATAAHETAHTFGVGTYTGASSWASHLSGGRWTGANAINELRSITGDGSAILYADSQHFWPNGLNQASEAKSSVDYVNHTRMVLALRRDMGL